MNIKIKNMIPNNFSVQLYDQITDKKLQTIYINNTINLDNDDEDFTRKFEEELLDDELRFEGIDITEVYYSIL
tara:strand:- start:17823 stop:18041 length:219 start_codon:yes stop_codon:yes gene_type:complete